MILILMQSEGMDLRTFFSACYITIQMFLDPIAAVTLIHHH